MTQFLLVLGIVTMITLCSGGSAICLALYGDPRNSTQKTLIEALMNITKMGTGALIGLLSGFQMAGA